MKTDDLITALAADSGAKVPRVERFAALLLPPVALGVALAVLLSMGFRDGLTHVPTLLVVCMKWAVSLPLALGGLFLAFKLARPQQLPALALPLVLLPALLLIGLIVFDFGQNGIAGWQARMIGKKGPECLFFVPLFSAAPLAAMISILRRGAVLRPHLAALAASLAATGIGASAYELHCTDDSPLFMGLWYVLGLAIVVLVGQALAVKALKW